VNSVFQRLRLFTDDFDKVASVLADRLFLRKLAAREVLVSAGRLNQDIFFVEKGAVRGFVRGKLTVPKSWVKGGISTRLLTSGDAVLIINGFFYGRLSNEELVAEEPSWVYVLRYEDAMYLTTKYIFLWELLYGLLCEYCFEMEIVLQGIRQDNAETRVEEFKQRHPEKEKIFSQKDISSYLGMTEVMYSRIKRFKND